jgi:membrane-bound ClpP family serine protease
MGHFGHFHLPHVPHGVHVPHVPHGVPHGAPHVAAGHPSGGGGGRGGAGIPWWNGFSIMIFICWFGASGYLLTRHGGFVASIVLVLAALCGVVGGALIFLFLTKVLLPYERELTDFETSVTGVVGRVTGPIRPGGTGEIVYEQMGARRSAPARSEDGEPIAKQEEVFVVRYERGIAYVRRWDEVENQELKG